MKRRCNLIFKLIFATIILFAGNLCILPSTSFAAKTTVTITYNAEDKRYYYDDGTTEKPKGNEKEPLIFDLATDKIILDYSGADNLAYPFYFELKNTGDSDYIYGKYMIEEVTEDKKLVFQKIGMMKKGASNWYTVTPENETTGKTYAQPGAIYHDKSEELGYTPPFFNIYSKVLFHQDKAYGTFLTLFDSDKYWLFEQRLGNTTISTNTVAATAASYPTAFVFCVSDFAEGDVEAKDLYKFSDLQISDKVSITVKEKKGTNAWKILSGAWFWDLVTGEYTLTPATYSVVGAQKLENSRLMINFNEEVVDGATYPAPDIKEFAYVFNGPSSDGLDGSDANPIEKVVSKLLISIGSVFRGAIGLMDGGSELSIDALIFNEYKQTKLDFFEPDGGVYTDMFSKVINAWFNAFKQFAIIIMILLIPAIAIKIVLYSGTPEQKKFPAMISGWIIAVAMLMFGPYVMKYVIELNNAIVKIFRDNSEYSIYSVYNADFIASHEWAQDYQIGEDSETSFLDWLQQNIDQTQKEWVDAAQELGQVSGEMEANLAAMNNWIGDLGLALIDIGDKIGENIKDTISFDMNLSGMEGEQIGNNFTLNSFEAVIDQAGKSKLFTDETTVSVSNVKVSIGGASVSLSELSGKVGTFISEVTEDVNSIIDEATRIFNEGLTAIEDFLGGLAELGNNIAKFFGLEEPFDEEKARTCLEDEKQANLARAEALKEKINKVSESLQKVFDAELQIERLVQERIALWKKYWDLQKQLEEMEDALAIFTKNLDLENAMKTRASKTYRLVLVAVWYILIYQLVLLMFLYYKRLLTVAVLIIIFPLVMMMYAIEQFLGKNKPASFKTWVQEYLINVFIQSIHALLYLSLVETGLSIYEADPDNWLILIFAISAIFPMEAIVKSMLGLKGSTVSNLATSAVKGAAAATAAVAIAKTATQGLNGKGIDEKTEAKKSALDAKVAKQDQRSDIRLAAKENKLKKTEARGGNVDDARKRLEESRAKAAAKSEARHKKIEKIKKRNDRMKKYKKMGQVARNLGGAAAAVTVGLAAGGDPSDFVVGSGIGKAVAGKVSNNKLEDALIDKPKDKKDAEQGYREEIAQKQAQANAPTQAAQNANAATQEAATPTQPVQPTTSPVQGNTQPQTGERTALQDAIQSALPPKQSGGSSNVDISSLHDTRFDFQDDSGGEE